MNCLDIVAEYLKQQGYDGLFNDFHECACLLDDLNSCGDSFGDCQPGYRVPCNCGDHDYHITEEKPEVSSTQGVQKAQKDNTPCSCRLPKCDGVLNPQYQGYYYGEIHKAYTSPKWEITQIEFTTPEGRDVMGWGGHKNAYAGDLLVVFPFRIPVRLVLNPAGKYCFGADEVNRVRDEVTAQVKQVMLTYTR